CAALPCRRLQLRDHALGEVVQATRDGLVVEPGRPHRDARHAQVLETAHAVQVGTAPACAQLYLLGLPADAPAFLAQHAEERAERSADGMPRASNASLSQPIPMPRIARPPERTSSVATSFAT